MIIKIWIFYIIILFLCQDHFLFVRNILFGEIMRNVTWFWSAGTLLMWLCISLWWTKWILLLSQCTIWLIFLSIKKVILNITLWRTIRLKFLWINIVISPFYMHQITIIRILSIRIINLLKVLQKTFRRTLRLKFFI